MENLCEPCVTKYVTAGWMDNFVVLFGQDVSVSQ